MISRMEKQKPCYALQIANQSLGSCSEYSAPLETLYVVTETIVLSCIDHGFDENCHFQELYEDISIFFDKDIYPRLSTDTIGFWKNIRKTGMNPNMADVIFDDWQSKADWKSN